MEVCSRASSNHKASHPLQRDLVVTFSAVKIYSQKSTTSWYRIRRIPGPVSILQQETFVSRLWFYSWKGAKGLNLLSYVTIFLQKSTENVSSISVQAPFKCIESWMGAKSWALFRTSVLNLVASYLEVRIIWDASFVQQMRNVSLRASNSSSWN